jgi:DNA topoisomerase-3
MVTWAFGHLVQLAMPEEYGFTGFVRENLPIIPETFKLVPRQVKDGREYKPDSGALRQLKIIKHVTKTVRPKLMTKLFSEKTYYILNQ